VSDCFQIAGVPQDEDLRGDEIAIDFPSIAPLIDRMRDAFFAGDRVERWSAHIELTRGEARTGARVPHAVQVSFGIAEARL
jgi:hypothetical protein